MPVKSVTAWGFLQVVSDDDTLVTKSITNQGKIITSHLTKGQSISRPWQDITTWELRSLDKAYL